MELVFASHNEKKVEEIKAMLPPGISLKSLRDIGWTEEIPETGSTLEENALIKARTVSKAASVNCFADDTGLIVPSLNGAPGVYSARYAGPQRSADDNMSKLLEELSHAEDRSAYFETSIALIIDGSERHVTGRIEGVILEKARGDRGFGYDPIFQPNGHSRSFAEMEMEEKGQLSHRGRAFEKMIQYIKSEVL